MPLPRATPLFVLMASLLLLGGCGALSSLMPGKKDDDTAAKPGATDAPVAYAIDVQAPKPLKTLLVNYLDLARFQALQGDDRVNLADLNRLVQATPAQARSLLETEGYFNATVKARRDGEQNGLPLVVVEVDPGPRTTVTDLQIGTGGAFQDALTRGDLAAEKLQLNLRRDFKLQPGKPFQQGVWSDAKNTTLAQARGGGYAAASWASTQANVDAPSNTARLELKLDSGPMFHFGEIKTEGLKRYQPQAITNLRTFEKGTPYTEKTLLDFQDRLQRANLFESSVVEIDPDPAVAAATPVTVRVTELSKNQTEVGAGYSDSTGQRVSVEHLNRRLLDRSFFGTDIISRSKVELGRDRQTLESSLLTHALPGANRYLLSGKLQRETVAGAQINSASVRAGRTFESEHIDRLVFLEGLAASTRGGTAGNRIDRSLSGNYHFTVRDLDSIIVPTRGRALHAELAGGYAVSDVAASGPFGRALGRVTLYRPLGDKWFGQARIEAAQVFAKRDIGIPDTLLFRAGGDDSVRGYQYRSLGPLVNGTVSSGRVLLTGSLEATTPIYPPVPALLGAVFIDAGAAANEWNELRPVVGYGVGVRMRSPVGPLRVDIAYGQDVREFRLHFGVGITF